MYRTLGFCSVIVLAAGLVACPSKKNDPDEEICANAADDDGDGLIDCADPDCSANPACQPETLCQDGLDNDGDGDTDCADGDCASQATCEATELTCDDTFDNDGDGLVDCADADCIGTSDCTAIPETSCQDGLDNDSDGDTDCADSDCANETFCESPEATCDDAFDNDGDGEVDCDDSDCIGTTPCTTNPETNCQDGLDNDSDGDTDCADSDCTTETYCEATEATCDDAFDNDGDGDVDCADSDCAAETFCEATEATCDDAFDNDGDGDVDCDDSDCTSAAACLPPAGVGSPCVVSTDCDDTGAYCLNEYDFGFPGGYCTVPNCDGSTVLCPSGSSCITIGQDVTMCVADCTVGSTDCRDAYACEDAGGAGICWPACTVHTQCPVTGQCDANEGLCVYGWVEADSPVVSGDDNDNGIADPGETFDLVFDAANVGYGVVSGPLSATVTVASTSTVSGTTILTPPVSTVCSAGDLPGGGVATCPAWGVEVPPSAQENERLDLAVAFSNATDTWEDVISLTIGSRWNSLLSALDAQGDSGSFACDLKDLQGYVDGGVMYLRMVFYTACSIDGYYELWLSDGSEYITLDLEDVGGTLTPTIWDYNGGSWLRINPVPLSYSITPTTGSSDTLTYQIAVADLPVLNTAGSTLYLGAGIAGPASTAFDDEAPETGAATISW